MMISVGGAAMGGTLLLAAAWITAALLGRARADVRHKVWLAGVLALAARAGLGFGRLVLATRSAERFADGVRLSSQVAVACTWGAFRPVILLPPGALQWAPARLAAAVAHERAHAARQDWLVQVFAQAMTVVFWFHPLVWLASARLKREAECAADDAVLDTGAAPADYAQQLLDAARGLGSGAPREAVAMVRTPILEYRVRAILDGARARGAASSRARLGVTFAALASAMVLAACSASAVRRMGEKGVRAPALVSKVEPDYTQEARDAKIQGTVVLRVVIDETGNAQRVEVTRSVDEGLAKKAEEAVRQWRFTPGTKDGKPVKVAATIEVNFRLQ
jgi:TonB family protein